MSQGQNFLPKFLFVSNLLKAVKIRERVPNDVVKPSASGGLIHHLRSMHRYTLEMIRMSQFPQAFREVIQAAILDRAMQSSLEQEKRLNWCREVKKLVPLRTNGDGNCLLHAASQYLLGVQDTDLVLRKALYAVLKETDTSNFRMRFQTELLHSQEFTQTGLRYSTLNWEEEWVKIVEMASPVSSSNGLQFDSLEDIHIFVLSNILRRPIIVIADQVLRSMKSGSSFSPLNVGGIYLPLHWPPGECYKYPIVLGYDSQHFAPLITIKDSGPEIRAVPLINPGRGGFEDLQVHFLTEKEQQQKEKLLKDYLMLIEIPVIGLSYDPTQIITAARLDEGNLPEDMNLMEDYLQLVNHEYKRWQEDKDSLWAPQSQRPPPFSVSQLSLIEIRCATPRCTFYVSVDTQPHCHECFEKRQAGCKPEAISTTNQTSSSDPESRGRLERSVSERGDTQQQEPRTEASVWAMHRETERTGTAGHTWQTPAARQCKRSGCQFFGTAEKLGFCTICYLDYQTNHLATPAVVQPRHTSEAGFQNCPRCRGQGCGAEGKAMLEGYCNKCFVKEQSARLNQAASRDSHSPPLVTRASKPRPPPMLTQAQCRRSGCKNLSPGCTDLCPDCLSRGQREGRRAQAPKEKSKQRCKTQGCDHYANQDKQGYCNECDHFKQIYRG
ncbi:LOW QUALITY PROTEIN: tumor necrosis factor alpha-induced protein 3 [Sinocyclocheilus rhinocerous]|uniref:LOW QUALITY PROTEIN: tumor necrosis factor alpha-induced protein 3 n=1 Tax=Sinocyclocheilus rhinocerous TaxID=307959 RepID=UPI0007B96137|nr:PREDICTED: LOW QUALITY PROTEIN: tumor necrosis factor alpha-induced protein 3 [Sinocyclocheilus rhinocerous]